jgi:LysM repeat protein
MKRSPARIFAPLALVACAVAVLAIVNSNNKSSSNDTSSTPAHTSTTSTTSSKAKKVRHTYIVKNGDVLSAISIRTGVPIETIMRLNPNVDAQTLHVGQKLKLAP